VDERDKEHKHDSATRMKAGGVKDDRGQRREAPKERISTEERR